MTSLSLAELYYTLQLESPKLETSPRLKTTVSFLVILQTFPTSNNQNTDFHLFEIKYLSNQPGLSLHVSVYGVPKNLFKNKTYKPMPVMYLAKDKTRIQE